MKREKEMKCFRLKADKHLFIIIWIDERGSVSNSQFIAYFGLVQEIMLFFSNVFPSDDECDQDFRQTVEEKEKRKICLAK